MKKNKDKIITLKITDEDYIGNEYINNEDCPIARALKRVFPGTDIAVGGLTMDIGDRSFIIPERIKIHVQRGYNNLDAEKAGTFKFKLEEIGW